MSLPPFLKELLETDQEPGPFTLRQTHISWLLFGPDRVFKIKKPVDLGFLDFRSLEKRQFFCEEEVRLNRRLSPEVYLGISEIRQLGGQLGIYDAGGPGELVDYAVTMKRLPEKDFMDQRLKQDQVSDQDLKELARLLAGFHKQAARDESVRDYGDSRAILRNISDNFAQTKPFAGSLYPKAWHVLVRSWSEHFLATHLDLFTGRQQNGFIREGHGDLHSGNICLHPTGVKCIDCIEFTPRFRNIDVVADMAFLIMDLEHAGHGAQAQVVQKAYLEDHEDPDFDRLLPFYKTYRAWVRGKVDAMIYRGLEAQDPERETVAEEAKSYFQLARCYVKDTLPHPVLFITCGLMGTGKSVLAKWLAEALDVPVLISDQERKKIFPEHQAPEEGLYATDGWNQGLYSKENIGKVYDHLFDLAHENLTAGQSLILDASFGKPHWRQRARDLAKDMNVPLWVFCTSTDADTQHLRLIRRQSHGEDHSDARPGMVELQRASFQPPGEDVWPDGTHLVNVDTSPAPDKVLKNVLASFFRG